MKKRIYEQLKNQLEEIIKERYDSDTDLVWSKTPSSELGDISFPLFNTAKKISKALPELGEEIKTNYNIPDYVDTIDLKGGFLNVFLNRNKFSFETTKQILETAKYGQSTSRLAERIIIEHTSSNPTSPLHVGHIRNSILGDVLGRLFKITGAAVNFRYYVNDLGRQIAPLIIGYFLLKEKGIESDSKVDLWIGKIYATMNTLLEIQQLNKIMDAHGLIEGSNEYQYIIKTNEVKDYKEKIEFLENTQEEKDRIGKILDRLIRVQQSLEEKIPDVYIELRKLVTEHVEDLNQLTLRYVIKYQEGKDSSIVAKFREVTQAALSGHVETLKLFNIFHDDFDWESDVAWSGEVESILDKLETNNYLVHDGKARLLNNEKIASELGYKQKYGINYELQSYIIVNSEGITLYPCRDIAYHLHKLEKFDATYCYNVINKEQQLPQLAVKLALYGLGEQELADKIEHFEYENVNLVGRKMAGREFEYVTPDELYELVKEEVNQILEERDYSETESKLIAEKVSSSSIKYYILRMDPQKIVVFDVKKAVNLNENTGPFLQYSYARALNIIKKASEQKIDVQLIISSINESNFEIEKNEEWEIIKLMEELPYALIKAADTLRPDTIANFTYSIVAAFHKFYDSCPVLVAKTENLKKSRILIVYCILRCLETLFEVIGIDTLEKM